MDSNQEKAPGIDLEDTVVGTGGIEDVNVTVVPVGHESVAQNTGDAAQDGNTD